ncbi:MAG TPA: ThiF family adenylyltransferase [Pedobacter sp.]|uniref:ThiF family adenylyltransferase n=1 Tax=Pedobacter sp. TaxID=1411316 RepID=UPI002BDC61C7|nr:ThiF family adenylyltransferase [Pedobacter sp.]HMI02499.1 ThiF family adenylyltransferase [Pedobacter sp.]
MNYAVAISEENNKILLDHLIRRDGQEDLCFALYEISNSKSSTFASILEIILPEKGDREVHGNVSFNPQFLDRVTSRAIAKKCGICFMHSHPSYGWQGMSQDDVEAESMLAPRVKAITALPLLGMTLSQDGLWSARFWVKDAPKSYKRHFCNKVRVVGKGLHVSFYDELSPKVLFGEEFTRTISSWGEAKQSAIARLRIGIVGLGSVGSIIAESLVRTGVQQIVLIDFDKVERKNLDRLQGIGPASIGKLKVEEIKKYMESISSGTAGNISAVPYSIVESEGMLAALDCDLLFCCVDRPWPRYILDRISFANLIPIIDGGIDAEINKKHSNLHQARWKAHACGPGRICMKCIGQYTPEDVSLEMSGLLEDQHYIKGLPKEHFVNGGENVYAFSMGVAAMEMHQFLSMVLMPKGQYYGPKEYDFNSGNIDADFPFSCKNNCDNLPILATGDKINKHLISTHEAAAASRNSAEKIVLESPGKTWLQQLKDWTSRMFSRID